MKKIIYDFDGTLTTTSLPFYEFLNRDIDEIAINKRNKRCLDDKRIVLYC